MLKISKLLILVTLTKFRVKCAIRAPGILIRESMFTNVMRKILIVTSFIFLSICAFGQPLPGPPPPPDPVPITGAGFLIALGLMFGIKKLIDKRKQ
jgi:hypothetical protein